MGAPWIKQFRDILSPVLTETQMRVLESRLYEALMDSDTHHSEQLAEELEVSRQRVHQIWVETVEQLRMRLANTRLSPNAEEASRYLSETLAGLDAVKERLKSASVSATLASAALTVGVRKLRPGNSHPVTRGMVPTRVYRRLNSLGIKSIEDFAKVKGSDLLLIRGFGRGTLDELKKNLATYGIVMED